MLETRRLKNFPFLMIVFIAFVFLFVFAGCEETERTESDGDEDFIRDIEREPSESDWEPLTPIPSDQDQTEAETPLIAIRGSAIAMSNEGQPVLLAGAKACVLHGTDPLCSDGDKDGKFVIPGIPANMEISIGLNLEGYYPHVFTVQTGNQDMDFGQIRMLSNVEIDAFAQGLGITLDSEKSLLVLDIYSVSASDPTVQTPLVGASVSVTPLSGTGPYFLDADYLYDATLTATGESGIVIFANLTPGEVSVEVTHNLQQCRLYWNWGATGEQAAARAMIFGGRMTNDHVLCFSPDSK